MKEGTFQVGNDSGSSSFEAWPLCQKHDFPARTAFNSVRLPGTSGPLHHTGFPQILAYEVSIFHEFKLPSFSSHFIEFHKILHISLANLILERYPEATTLICV